MRPFVSSGSIVLLLWILTVAPFVHAHPEGGHGGGMMVHGHLPVHRHPADIEGEGASVDAGDHDGRRVDLFASVAGKTDPDVLCLEVVPDSISSPASRFARWSADPAWERGPPASRVSPRAPPAELSV